MHIVASPASRASVLQRLRVSQPRARLRSAVRAPSPRNNGERKHESAHGTTARKSSHKDAPVETPVFQPMQEARGATPKAAVWASMRGLTSGAARR